MNKNNSALERFKSVIDLCPLLPDDLKLDLSQKIDLIDQPNPDPDTLVPIHDLCLVMQDQLRDYPTLSLEFSKIRAQLLQAWPLEKV